MAPGKRGSLRDQLINMHSRHPQAGDLFFLPGDERIKLRDLGSVLALFVLAEAEQVRLVLRTPAMEIKPILVDDGLPESLRLVELRSMGKLHSGLPVRGAPAGYPGPVDLQGIF